MGIKIIKPGIRNECAGFIFCGDDVASALNADEFLVSP